MKPKSSIGKTDGKTRKWLIKELLVTINNINWPIEMKLMKSLLKNYSEPDFWIFLSKRNKFTSLMSLASQKELILKTRLEYDKEKFVETKKSLPVELQQQKLGEDIIKQPVVQKTLFDFIEKKHE